MKKIATLLVALLFALGLSIPAFAEKPVDSKAGTPAVETKKDEGKATVDKNKTEKKHVKKSKKGKKSKKAKSAEKSEPKAETK